jgi:UDP-N-acetylmuramate dehydrogenase
MEWQSFVNWLQSKDLGRVSQQEPLSDYTSWRIGGPARVMFWPKSVEACIEVLQRCHEQELPRLFLGNGTNLLVADEGVDALVINTRSLNNICWQGQRVLAEAGASLASLASQAGRRGLKGLEFAIGIPGSLGGAVLMNAGAYGGEMSDLVEWVMVVDDKGQSHRLAKEDIGYTYRHSILQEKDWFIGEISLAFQPGDQAAIEQLMNQYLQSRREKQPLELPNGGSVFKNPSGQGAGRHIEAAGLKGLRVGDAQVSTKHANFIVNLGQATASDVAALIKIVQERVKLACGIQLEKEVIYWGCID